MRWINILVLVVSINMLGCSNDEQKINNKIILIFQNRNLDAAFSEENCYILRYVDEYMIPRTFKPGEFGQYKYAINTSKKYLDIALQYGNDITRHFVFKKGDSVLISLNNKWPVASILNRKHDKYQSNFEMTKHFALYNDKPSALEDFYLFWNLANAEYSPISCLVISEELHSLKDKALKQMARESLYLDSLLNFEVLPRI